MKKLFANVWTKRVFSLVSGAYAFVVCYLCYCSLFYDIHIESRFSLTMLITAFSLLTLMVMIYTRKQFLTKLASVIILPAMLPVILLFFGEWGMIIPIIAVGVIILLLSGASEGFKTALGTIVLLMYIFGALGYFIFTSFFITTSKTEVVKSGFSPSQKYRYRVINTEDSSMGSTTVCVEPNDADIHYPYVTFSLKNIERTVYLERPIAEQTDVQWTTQTRQEITAQLNAISDSIAVHLSESKLKTLGFTYESKLILTNLSLEQKEYLGIKHDDMTKIYLETLNAEQLAYFGISKASNGKYLITDPPAKLFTDSKLDTSKVPYLNDITPAWRKEYNVEKDDSVLLSELTDAQLAALGVPDTSDVMTFNGKICFRSYIAALEEYFDVDDRSITVSLLN